MRCLRWHISIYINKIKLHGPRHCKKKGSNFFVPLWRISLEDFARAPRNHDGVFTSCVLAANQITSLVGQMSGFWSGPSDDIREHMGETKNRPDRRVTWYVCERYFFKETPTSFYTCKISQDIDSLTVKYQFN